MSTPGTPEIDPPNAGTRCFPCYLLGHYCRATTWWYEVAVCESCSKGQLCPHKRAVDRMLNPGQDWRNVA